MTATVGSYELLGTVATTATATVWKARDVALDRTIAVKQVRTDSPAAGRVRAEAAMLAQIRHPNIVTIYDLLELDGSLWLAEQWIDGAPLHLVTAKARALRPVDALAVTRGALEGLGHAHEKGIVHGDVTPVNILVDATGKAMLVDFGLAAPAGTPGIGGTPGYVAPEVAAGEPLTPRSDVYSAAATLARLLLGHSVYTGTTPADILTKQRTRPPRLSGIDTPVADVLALALSVDPASRPADATELLSLLDDAAEKAYGRGWLAGSSLGALGGTAATIAAGIQVGGSVASSIAGSAAAPAAGTTLGKLAASVTSKKLLAVGGVAAVAVGIFGYNALRNDTSESNNTAAQQQSAQPNKPASDLGQPQHPSAALSGTYDVVAALISGNFYERAAERELRWQMTATPVCPGPNLPCSVGISTESGSAAVRFANSEWSSTYGHNGKCVDNATGIPTGGKAPITTTIVIRISPEGIAGTIEDSAAGDCPGVRTYNITGTRVE